MARQATAPSLTIPPDAARDHIRGVADPAVAAVTLVEYGDYECPHCGRAHPIVEQLLADLPGKLCFIYRHFPLAKMHPHARPAAEAAEAAGAQGKFWEMHEMLFAHQEALERDDLLSYGREIGLDVARFRSELADRIYGPRVQEDLASGIRSGVNGTPTFFINGTRHNGGYELDILRPAILAAVGIDK